MRRFGFALLITGIIGVCINNTILACVSTILGSIVIEADLLYKHRKND